MNILKGYMTYIMAGLAVLGGIAGLLMGYINTETALAMIWAGMATFGIRRAVA